MPFVRKTSMLLLMLVFAGSSVVFADVDKDKDKDKRKKTQTEIAALKAKFAGLTGACDLGSASADLDVNNVKARMYNNGGLFWIGGSPIYEVPKGSGQNAIFASGMWIGGFADGELRVAAATYGSWEFWPGPLDEAGQPPLDCAPFDRIFKVSRTEIDAFQRGGAATDDIRDWPWQLGAPVKDGDGNPNNYNLEGGDLPGIIGDQTIWWVMNDAGNIHQTTETPPIGLEVQATVFAFNQAGALGNTTFYKYKFIYKGTETLTDVYLGLWSDPDLGDAADDYVGSDSLLGLGYVMNGDDFDGGSSGYGDRPPALGYDFFQGPLVDNDGLDNNRNGEIDEPGERVAMAKFVFYNNNSSVQGNPNSATEIYQYLAGQWRDGQPITFGGTGRGFSTDPANYMFPANPPEFWSEDQPTPGGTPNVPSDRRFLQSAGPFTMQPGDVQEIVFGIVWAQSANRVLSVNLLKQEDAKAQAAFDADFNVPPPPAPPRVTAEALDGQVMLRWSYNPTDNGFQEVYDETSINIVVPNAPDTTYTFEGYVVYQFTDPTDNVGRPIAVYDKINDARAVVEEGFDEVTGQPRTFLLAAGTNTGIRRQHLVTNLVNNTEYIFGVQAYAYNQFSNPQWLPSPISRITVSPTASRTDNRMLSADDLGRSPEVIKSSFGSMNAVLADPTSLAGDEYAVEFFLTNGQMNYNIVTTQPSRQVRFSGEDYFAQFGTVAPQGPAAVTVDGIVFSISSPDFFRWHTSLYNDFTDFARNRPIQREFIVGPVEFDGDEIVPKAYHPPQGTVVRFYSIGDAAGERCRGANSRGNTKSCFVGDFDGDLLPDTVRAITEVAGDGGANPCPTPDPQCRNGERIVDFPFFSASNEWSFIELTTQSWERIIAEEPNTFEIRFTGTQDQSLLGLVPEGGSIVAHIFTTSDDVFVPYEVWDIGNVRPGEANDPSDDVRMLPFHFSDNAGEVYFDYSENTKVSEALFGITSPDEWPLGDFGISDRIYAYYPVGASRAERQANAEEYEAQTRAAATGPIQAGDSFTFPVAELRSNAVTEVSAEERLDKITIVPNPYLGASDYEVSRVVDVARITNLPRRATVRMFTLNGTLIRTLEKNSDAAFINWDLNTDEGLPIASGIYLIHVDAKDDSGATVGERVLKFAVVKKKVQLNEL